MLNPNNVHFPVNIINLALKLFFLMILQEQIGVIFVTVMSMDIHILSTVKSFFIQRRDFRRVYPFISKTVAITLAYALAHSCLDFCSSLF